MQTLHLNLLVVMENVQRFQDRVRLKGEIIYFPSRHFFVYLHSPMEFEDHIHILMYSIVLQVGQI